MDIVIIGAGNTATVLGRKFFSAGHSILQLYNRHKQRGQTLAAELQASFTDQKHQIVRRADMYLIALSDDSIPEFVSALAIDSGLVVHTAGSVSIDILKPVATSCGVLYPLQSLQRGLTSPEVFPFLIDAVAPEALATLRLFCESLGMPAIAADDATRLRYHLAAVMANNFSNHLFALTETYCAREQLDFSQLFPLIRETAGRLSYRSARDSQTGPALRNDRQTIAKHLDLLTSYPHLQSLYETMTRSIHEMYG